MTWCEDSLVQKETQLRTCRKHVALVFCNVHAQLLQVDIRKHVLWVNRWGSDAATALWMNMRFSALFLPFSIPLYFPSLFLFAILSSASSSPFSFSFLVCFSSPAFYFPLFFSLVFLFPLFPPPSLAWFLYLYLHLFLPSPSSNFLFLVHSLHSFFLPFCFLGVFSVPLPVTFSFLFPSYSLFSPFFLFPFPFLFPSILPPFPFVPQF